MTIIQRIKSSLFDPGFYKKAVNESGWKAFRYYLLLALILSVLTAVTSIPFIFSLETKVSPGIYDGINQFPQDVSIKIHNGVVSTNVEEPYKVSISTPVDPSLHPAYYVVVDTKTPFSTTQFNEYNAEAWLGRDALYVRSQSNSEIRIYNLSRVKDFTLNRTTLKQLADKFIPLIKLLIPLIIPLVAIVLYVIFLFRILSVLLAAILVWIIGRFTRVQISYGQAIKVSFYAVTAGYLVEFLILLINTLSGVPVLHGFPFMTVLITGIVAYINLSKISRLSIQNRKPQKKTK